MAAPIKNLPSKRRSYVLHCEQVMKEKDLFKMEDCLNFLEEENRLTKYPEEKLPGGSVSFSLLPSGHSIKVDVGVSMKKQYLKFLIRKFLHRKGLKDWIKVLKGENKNDYSLVYYNLVDEEAE
jgi:Ribosomal L22e protein family